MTRNVPDDIKELVDRAAEFQKQNRDDEAIELTREALKIHPDLAVLHNNLGCSLANLEDYEEAAKEFEEAIRLTPINRQNGDAVPNSYPKEPEQNLRSLQGYIKAEQNLGSLKKGIEEKSYGETIKAIKNVSALHVEKPARNPDRSLRHEPIRRGMGFPTYIFWFLARNPIGWFLTIAAVVVTGVFWNNKSPDYPLVFSISCIVILIAAYVAYATDPRLR